MSAAVVIRRESVSDGDAIRGVHNSAFGVDATTPTWEARLVDDLREGPSWIPELSIVAEVDGQVVGHALATRGRLERAGTSLRVHAVGLAPVGVLPDHQGSGVGTALITSVLGTAQALGVVLVCLLGNPVFYGRFGFALALDLGISPPHADWAEHFQARRLTAEAHAFTAATFRYDAAFDRPV